MATAARCSGVVPQQPPISETPYCSTNPANEVANSAGDNGYKAPFGPRIGKPALGMQDIPSSELLLKVRRCSLISAGPVAQFKPIRSIPSGASAFKAALISEPSNMVPVVSTVTCAIKTISRSDLSITERAPFTAALACNRS